MKRILLILLALLLSLSLFACNEEEKTEKPDPTNYVQFTMSDGSAFVVELYPEYAPQTVENFQALVSEGFYNGLTFHRIYKNFMIQGGAPKDGTKTESIYGEFSSNGFAQNTLKHERGVLSMARSNDPNSASSQFFIMHDDAPHLDGNYAAFGRVVWGMDTVDALAELPVTYNWSMGGEMSKPLQEPVIKDVTFITAIPE